MRAAAQRVENPVPDDTAASRWRKKDPRRQRLGPCPYAIRSEDAGASEFRGHLDGSNRSAGNENLMGAPIAALPRPLKLLCRTPILGAVSGAGGSAAPDHHPNAPRETIERRELRERKVLGALPRRDPKTRRGVCNPANLPK